MPAAALDGQLGLRRQMGQEGIGWLLENILKSSLDMQVKVDKAEAENATLRFELADARERLRLIDEAGAAVWVDEIREWRDKAMKAQAELAGWETVGHEVSKVYCHITNGRMSKPDYAAEAVIAACDDVFTETLKKEMAETAERLTESAANYEMASYGAQEKLKRVEEERDKFYAVARSDRDKIALERDEARAEVEQLKSADSHENCYGPEALRRLDAKNAALQAEVRRLMDVAREGAAATELEHREWQAETGRLRDTIEDLRARLGYVERTRDDHKNAALEMREEVRKLHAHNQAVVPALQAEVGRLNARIADMGANGDSFTAQYYEDVDKLLDERDSLQAEVARLRSCACPSCGMTHEGTLPDVVPLQAKRIAVLEARVSEEHEARLKAVERVKSFYLLESRLARATAVIEQAEKALRDSCSESCSCDYCTPSPKCAPCLARRLLPAIQELRSQTNG